MFVGLGWIVRYEDLVQFVRYVVYYNSYAMWFITIRALCGLEVYIGLNWFNCFGRCGIV